MYRIILPCLASVLMLIMASACSKKQSYTDLLNEESKAVNLFLANHKVAYSIPADSVFEVGPDAPYYPLDSEGKLFMQVLHVGDGKRAESNQLIYFRYTRYSLKVYAQQDTLMQVDGNENTGFSAESFRYQDYLLPSTTQWGTGIQKPLDYLPLNSEVNLVVKGEYSKTEESSYVLPMLVNIRYFPARL